MHSSEEKELRETIERSRSHRRDALDRMFDRFLSDHRSAAESSADAVYARRDDSQARDKAEDKRGSARRFDDEDENKQDRDTRLEEVHKRG